MSSAVALAVVFLACALTLSTGQSSCKGRCGAEYYRGYMCQCDYTCLSYEECCDDYESQCTTKNSCKGRCGESFKRGRRCSCDPNCQKYKQCCSDFQDYCEDADGPDPSPEVAGGNDPDVRSTPLVVPAGDPGDHSNESDSPPDLGSSTEGPGAPTPDPGSSSADGLSDDPAGSTPDSNSAEVSRETLTVVPPTPPADDAARATDAPANPTPAGGQAATDKSVTAETTPPLPQSTSTLPKTTSTLPQSTSTLPKSTPALPKSTAAAAPPSRPSPSSVPRKEQFSTVGVAVAGTVELEVQTASPDEGSAAPASSDGPQVTQTPPSPAVTSASARPGVSVTIALETSEPTSPSSSSSSPSPSSPQPTTTTSKDATLGPLLQELLATLVPGSSDAVRGDDIAPGGTTNGPSAVTQKPAKATQGLKPDKPVKPSPTKAAAVTARASIDDLSSYQADDSNDTNLCSGRPVGGVTTLRNGTMVVFRGHYFWVLDKNKVPGPARGITQVWGVPSPIDTVFTRCNCEGKTYIFKGNQYWRFDNGAVDSGYPKAIQTGFDGLRGHITAALSVPQYRQRREAVYFFKRGGLVQKYSYHLTPSPSCGAKPKLNIYTIRNRVARQVAVSNLGATIKIRATWTGFPSTITAAVSVPNQREPEGYKYYVFSRANFYKVQMDSERPTLSAPATNTSPQNSFFKCPQKA